MRQTVSHAGGRRPAATMTIAERILALKTTPPFDRLRDSELALIGEVARVRRYAADEIVCAPHKPLQRLHVVVEGTVRDSAGEAVPAVFGVGALLYELAVADTLVAAPPDGAVCLLINKGNLYTTLHECPALVVGLLEMRPAVL